MCYNDNMAKKTTYRTTFEVKSDPQARERVEELLRGYAGITQIEEYVRYTIIIDAEDDYELRGVVADIQDEIRPYVQHLIDIPRPVQYNARGVKLL
jgi:hypothetical protein